MCDAGGHREVRGCAVMARGCLAALRLCLSGVRPARACYVLCCYSAMGHMRYRRHRYCARSCAACWCYERQLARGRERGAASSLRVAHRAGNAEAREPRAAS